MFDEDRSQVRCDNIPHMMAALRHTAIGLLRWAGHTNIAATCRRLAAQPLQALACIGIKFENCMALPWKGRSSMEIVQRRELWIHTHFVTDCTRLSSTQGRDIEAAVLPVLRQQHIVYGIHFEKSRHDPGIRIVLECIPLRRVLEQIETALRRIIAPIPAKPTPVQTVTTEPPHIVTLQEAR